MPTKFKSYIVLAVVLASAAVGVVSSTPIAAQAPDGVEYTDTGYASSTLTQSVKNKTYGRIMQECIKQISQGNAKGYASEDIIRTGSTWLSYPFDGLGSDNHIFQTGYITTQDDD
jgi:hypothetical protein